MSLGVCGKRLGFEEIIGSSSPSRSAKRSRCSHFRSPVQSPDLGLGSEDKVEILLRMFPAIDRVLVESVINSHSHKFDDAIESLRAFCVSESSATSEPFSIDSMIITNGNAVQDYENSQTSEKKVKELHSSNWNADSSIPTNGSAWVDLFVKEMMSVSDLDEARACAAGILTAFEGSVINQSNQLAEREVTLMKEHLQALLRDNQILKRAVTIQHERNSEQEEKIREMQQLKHVLSQYQEQLRSLELSNYTLKLHLQRTRDGSSIPCHFNPDVY